MAKRTRKSGMRRAHLKMFSNGYVNVGKAPNTILMARAQHSAKSLGTLLLTPERPKTEGVLKTDALVEHIKLTERWASELRMQGIIKYHSISIDKGRFFDIDLHFSGLKWVFLKKDHKKRTVVRSEVYYGREDALIAFNTNRINWILQSETPIGELKEDT